MCTHGHSKCDGGSVGLGPGARHRLATHLHALHVHFLLASVLADSVPRLLVVKGAVT